MHTRHRIAGLLLSTLMLCSGIAAAEQAPAKAIAPLRGTIAHLESRGPVVAVTIALGPDGGQLLRADLTPGAVAELALVPGTTVWAAMKATQVSLYPSAPGGAGY